MTSGLEIRASIDTENVRGLLLINGGAAIALLGFLPFVLDRPRYLPLAQAALWALLLFLVGLAFAVLHNRFRRLCSLEYEQHQYRPPPGQIRIIQLKKPTVCAMSELFMWLSLAAFVAAGLVVFLGGFRVLNDPELGDIDMTTEIALISLTVFAVVVVGGIFWTKTPGFGKYTTSLLLLSIIVFLAGFFLVLDKISASIFANIAFAVAGFGGGLLSAKKGDEQ